MRRLNDPPYLAFPFQIDRNGAQTANRVKHVRQQIEQVIFTNPYERVFRPEFGVGIKKLIFEPNASALWEVTRKRLMASLAEALQGEVDPRSLEVQVRGVDEKLIVEISYSLATIGQTEKHEFLVS
ncbi:MAG: GPW/gp25 family protein [Desulfobacca sp.]|nr:GPW/gp25 family protein [Desulfobacca sp.]